MAEIPPGPTEPLDVQRIHYLARLMKRYDLSSLDLADGQAKIPLRPRGAEVAHLTPGGAPQPPAALASAAYTAAPAGAAPAQPSPPPAPSAEKAVYIESPMVGTYYTSRAPDA